MTPTIEATGLRKRYGSVAALDGLDLAVEEGHVVGLLGPNGAGKTTALRILVGLVRADAGTVTIAGEPVDLAWVAGERVGAMVATPVFYPHLSGAENLRVLAAAWGWPRARADARIDAALRRSISRRRAGAQRRATRPGCGNAWASPSPCSPTHRS